MNPETGEQLETMLGRYIDAVRDKDPERLASLYAADIRVFDAWDSWSFQGIKAWRDNLHNWLGSLGSERVEVRFDDIEKQGDENFGYLSAIGRYAAIDADGAEMRSMQNRFSWVLKRCDGAWLIVHEHTSAPISFSDTKAILQRD